MTNIDKIKLEQLVEVENIDKITYADPELEMEGKESIVFKDPTDMDYFHVMKWNEGDYKPKETIEAFREKDVPSNLIYTPIIDYVSDRNSFKDEILLKVPPELLLQQWDKIDIRDITEISNFNIDLYAYILANKIPLEKVFKADKKVIIDTCINPKNGNLYTLFSYEGFNDVVFFEYYCPSTGLPYIITFSANIYKSARQCLDNVLNNAIPMEMFCAEG